MLAKHLFKHPGAAFYRTGPVGEGSHRENARHAQNPATIGIRDLDASYLCSGDIFFEPINLREVFIHKSVIAIDESDDVLIFADDGVKK